MKEQRVSVGHLKARLSEYLRQAGAGTPVIITSHGRPVARLVPLEGAAALEGRMEHLVRSGLVRLPVTHVNMDRLLSPGPADPCGRGVAGVLEERAEGW